MLYLSKLSYEPFIGNGQPTNTTNLPTHYVGRLYVDTQTGLTYRLIQDATDNNVWEVIGDGTVKTDAADVAGYLDSKLDTAYFKIVNHKLTIEETGIAKTNLSNVDANDILGKLLTVDGNGSGLDADNLDGLDSTQFVRSDQDDTMNGNYTITGNLDVNTDLNIGGNATISGDVTIQGDATINGNLTTINTTNLEIEDNEIILNKGETGSGVTEGSAGITIDRGTATNARLIFDESDDRWKVDWGDGTLRTIVTDDGGGVDAGTLDGLDSTQFLRSDVNDTWNGVLNTTKDGDRLVLQPETSGQWVGIRFDSQVNTGSDLGYIRWYDDNNDYNYWGDSNENGALVIGVENDGGGATTSDVVVLKSPASIINDAPEFRVVTSNGYGRLGAFNGSWFHFYTDRPAFYFDKDVRVNGVVGVYNTSTYLSANDGYISGAQIERWNFNVINTDTNANVWDYLLVDTSGGQVTVTLPSSPSNFSRVFFLDSTGSFDVNSLIVARNGATIMGLAEDMEVTSKNISFGLIYYNGDWRITNE